MKQVWLRPHSVVSRAFRSSPAIQRRLFARAERDGFFSHGVRAGGHEWRRKPLAVCLAGRFVGAHLLECLRTLFVATIAPLPPPLSEPPFLLRTSRRAGQIAWRACVAVLPLFPLDLAFCRHGHTTEVRAMSCYYQETPMPVWKPRPPSKLPKIPLSRWRIFEAEDGSEHFAGVDMFDSSGRASSPIVRFDPGAGAPPKLHVREKAGVFRRTHGFRGVFR
jgi:hypothetical protein